MRRLSLTAFLAVPLLLLIHTGKTEANPYDCRGFGCGGVCLNLFPGIHQHGPLFNYGPYYGYYPFKPYGPWDAYLHYDPYFYGDPYRYWGANQQNQPEATNMYGRNEHFPYLRGHGIPIPGILHPFHKHGCLMCGFWHASWLHGGWFRGHAWLHGGFGHFHKPACTTCGAIAVAQPAQPKGDVLTRYSGIGDPAQSAVYYSALPTLDPALELVPTAGQEK